MNEKRKVSRRLICVALIIALMLSCVPTNVYATEDVAQEPVVEDVVEETTEEVQEEPAEEVQEEPAEEVQGEPAEEIQEEPAEEIQEEPAEEIQEESAEEVQEEPAEEVQEEPIEERQEESIEEDEDGLECIQETAAPDMDLPDNEELFAGYVDKVFYGNDGVSMFSVGDKTAGAQLTGDEKIAYDIIISEVKAIAAGERTSSVITMGAAISDGTNTYIPEFEVEFSDTEFDLNAVVGALLVDCPYELFWYDKTEGCKMSRWIYSSDVTAYIQFTFTVANDYRSAESETTVVRTTAVTTAYEEAQRVVAEYAGYADYEKLKAYKEYICNAVEYDDDAVADDYTGGYGDPWQLIYAFDKDSTTNIVCEGYSKAFQYLCDLSSFRSDKISCYSVSGYMVGGTGAGPHMWNIVTMEDGYNYLVDITNSDTGTIGQSGGLFLAGGLLAQAELPAEGSDEPVVMIGYLFEPGGYQIFFSYDDDIIWGADVLTLSDTDYVVKTEISDAVVKVNAASLTYTGAPITPEVTVTLGDTVLSSETDYDVSYSDNVNAGTATVTVTGKGYYIGTAIGNFTIEKSKLTIAEVEFDENSLTKIYDGTTAGPIVTSVTFTDANNGNVGFVLGTDFTVTALYEDANVNVEASKGINVEVSLKDAALANYELVSAVKTIEKGVITPAALEIKVDDKSVIAGSDMPEFTYSADGFVSSDHRITTEPVLKCTATDTKTVGTYDITADVQPLVIQDRNGNELTANYEIECFGGTLTIEAHKHHWASFTADGAVITAQCDAQNCTYDESKATVTLTEPENLVYTGVAKTAEIQGSIEEITLPEIEYSGDCTNVGRHTASLTIDGCTATLEFEISAAVPSMKWENVSQNVFFNGNMAEITAPTVTLINAETYTGDIFYEYRTDKNGEYVAGLPTNAGTYYVKAEISAFGNYTAAETASDMELTISVFETNAVAVLTDTNKGSDDWYHGDVTIQAPEGFEVSDAVKGAYANTFVVTADSDSDGTEIVYFLKEIATGYITEAKTMTVKRDTVAPSGEITIETNSFKEYLNEFTFGLFFKKTVDVKINGADALSGVDEIYYQKVVSDKDYAEDGTWTKGESLSVAPNEKFAVYAKIIDKAGNTAIINSNGTVVYTDASLSVDAIVYTKTSKTDLQAEIILNGNTINTVSVDGAVLKRDVDYTIKDNKIMLKGVYLETLNTGSHEIKISYHPLGETYVSAEGNEAPAVTTIPLTVNRAEGQITEIEDLSKTYDGKPTALPKVTTNSTGAVKVEYKLKDAKDSTYTATAPKDAGDYTVRITVAADETYAEATETKDFTILKAPAVSKIDSSVTAQAAGKGVELTVNVGNINEISVTPDSITVVIKVQDEVSMLQVLAQKSAGVYTGTYIIPADLSTGTLITMSVDKASDANFVIAPDATTIQVSSAERKPLSTPELEGNKEFKLEMVVGTPEVPEELRKKEHLNTWDKIENQMEKELTSANREYEKDHTETYEVELMYREKGENTWKKAGKDYFKDGKKMTVVLPYPKGTGKDTHDFVAVHMFTSGDKAGMVEMPTVRKEADGLHVEVTGLSPITIGWKKVSAPTVGSSAGNSSDEPEKVEGPILVEVAHPAMGQSVAQTSVQTTGTNTGDESHAEWYIAALLLAGAGVFVLTKKKRKKDE